MKFPTVGCGEEKFEEQLDPERGILTTKTKRKRTINQSRK
jgi:hypothetical protein